MVRQQGDLFWLDFDEPVGSEAGYRRPVLIVQNNLQNAARIETTVVCALSTNLNRAQNRNNVLLESGEGNLPKRSVVIVSQIDTVNKNELQDFIGRLRPSRMQEVLTGLWGVFKPVEADEKEDN